MNQPKVHYRWLIPIGLISVLIFAVLQQIWLGKNGYADRLKRSERVKVLAEEEDQLIERRQYLRQHIERMKYWDSALESTARETLSMIKDNEEFYQFKKEGAERKKNA